MREGLALKNAGSFLFINNMLKYLRQINEEKIMAKNIEKDPFDTDIDDTVFVEKNTKKCPTCAADIETDAQFCPYCGSKIGESVKNKELDEEIEEMAKEEEAPKVIKPRPLAKGEKVQKSATPTKEYKYGDGYSVSALSLWALYGCWAYPIISLVMSLIGLHSKNPKDIKLFKIAIILDVVFLIVHIVVIYLYFKGAISLS